MNPAPLPPVPVSLVFGGPMFTPTVPSQTLPANEFVNMVSSEWSVGQPIPGSLVFNGPIFKPTVAAQTLPALPSTMTVSA